MLKMHRNSLSGLTFSLPQLSPQPTYESRGRGCLCQVRPKSKAPPGSTDSPHQTLVTPAANPAQTTNNYFSANTDYRDTKELNKWETLCWTLRTEGSLPRRILICSLPRASPAALELLQVYSTDQTEYFAFFFLIRKAEIFPSCCFQRREFQSHSDKQKIQHTVRKCISLISLLAHSVKLAVFLKIELLLKKTTFQG